MVYRTLSKPLASSLLRAFREAFVVAEQAAATVSEPQVVRQLAYDIAQRVNAIGAGPRRVSAELDFIHGTSIVDFWWDGATRHREVGDLLVVTQRFERGGFRSTRAVLLQAKRFKGRDVPRVVSKRDREQFILYRFWPWISYQWGHMPIRWRHLATRPQLQGSRFLFIPRRAVTLHRSTIRTTASAGGFGFPEPAPNYLLNMFRGHSAVPYEPCGPGDWNGLIDDLRWWQANGGSWRDGDRVFGALRRGDALEGDEPQLTVLWLTMEGGDPE